MIWHPKTSMEWQWAQHVVGGLSTILNQTTGVFAGMALARVIPLYIPVLCGIITWCCTRISSQITYETSKAMFKEFKR